MGSKGDSYDNAMAEALNSVLKAELIDRRAWPALTDVIVETSKWVGWYNTRRLHSAVGWLFSIHNALIRSCNCPE